MPDTQQSAPSLDDICQIGNHTRPAARALFWNTSLTIAAKRVEGCGREARLKECDQSHVTEHRHMCERGFACKICADIRVTELCNRYQHNLDALRDRRERGTFLEIICEGERDIEDMRTFQERTGRVLRRLIGPAAALWTYAIGFEGHIAVVRVLFQSPHIDSDTIQDALGQRYHIRSLLRSHNLHLLFHDHLLAVWRPATPEDQAEHEQLFQSYHRIRASGMPQNISVNKTTTQAVTEISGDHTHKKGEKCRICSHRIVRVSETFPLTATPAEKRALKWYPVPT